MNIFHNPDCLIDQWREGVTAYTAPGTGGASMVEGPDSLMLYAHSDQGGAYTVQRVSDPDSAGKKCWKVTVTTPVSEVTGGEGYMVYWPIEATEVVDLEAGTANAKDLGIGMRLRMPAGWTICMQITNKIENRSYVTEWTQPSDKNNKWHLHTARVPMDTSNAPWLTALGKIGLFVVLTLKSMSTWKASTAGAWVDGDKAYTDAQTNIMATAGNTFYIGKHTGTIGGDPVEQPQSYARSLRDCQRYARKSYVQGTPLGTATRVGEVASGLFKGGNSYPMATIPGVTMCRIPSVIVFSSTGAAGYVSDGIGQNRVAYTNNTGDTNIEIYTVPDGGTYDPENHPQRGFFGHYYANARYRGDEPS